MDDENKVRNKKIKIGVIYFSIILLIILFVNMGMNNLRNQDAKYSEFKTWVKNGEVTEVLMSPADGSISFKKVNDEFINYNTIATESLTNVTAFLEENNVQIYDGYIAESNFFLSLLLQTMLMFAPFLVLWYFISKNIGKGGIGCRQHPYYQHNRQKPSRNSFFHKDLLPHTSFISRHAGHPPAAGRRPSLPDTYQSPHR